MPETKVKKNPDYAESAVNLTNSPLVKQALDVLHEREHELAELITKRAELDPQLDADIMEANETVTFWRQRIKELIYKEGSYQDTEAGEYAVIQLVKKAEYHADPLMEKHPEFATICIIQSVNSDALKGLIKGRLVSQEQLENEGVITYSTSEKIIIK